MSVYETLNSATVLASVIIPFASEKYEKRDHPEWKGVLNLNSLDEMQTIEVRDCFWNLFWKT